MTYVCLKRTNSTLRNNSNGKDHATVCGLCSLGIGKSDGIPTTLVSRACQINRGDFIGILVVLVLVRVGQIDGRGGWRSSTSRNNVANSCRLFIIRRFNVGICIVRSIRVCRELVCIVVVLAKRKTSICKL